MPYAGEAHILRESQHAVYRNEIARLHYQLDVKNAANQILRDAMTAQRADHAASEARIRREMAPGFSWPDPDGTRLLSAKIDSQEATMTKMAAKTAKTSAENKRLKTENEGLRVENARLKAELAASGDGKLEKAVAELADVTYARDGLRRLYTQANGGDAACIVSRLARVVDEIGAMKRLHAGPEDDKLDRIAGELALITTELNALKFLRNNPDGSGTAMLIAELEKVTAERDALRNLYAHHNTSGTNLYTKRRSQVNDDIRNMEKEVAEELGTTLDAERAKAAEGSDARRAEGGCGGRAGSSHHNEPDEKRWYTRTQCPCCKVTGCLVRKRAFGVLVNDFFEDRMWIRTTVHIGVVYDCAACGRRDIQPDLPNIDGTSFGRKALSFIVQLGGKKNVDIDIAEMFGDMFDFKTAETTIWNARCAATDLLEHTMLIIRNALRKAKHLGIDETYYASEGDSGYVWVVRTDRVTFVLAMDSRGGDVIEKYMSYLLHIPVTTDGYSPYLTHFKILQRCWAHILRAAESAYVHSDQDSPMRAYYVDLYHKLLDIFGDAKRVAAKTAAAGGAKREVCAEFEERVMDIVAAYGNHDFATTLRGAAPNLFTFLIHPGMPPTNNDTERDIRDAVVVQRKIRRRFVNARGRHVFSVIQSFNSTCRKLGLVPWRCMERIIDDPEYDILEAGDDVKRLATPWSEAKPLTHRLCVDGKAVETDGITLSAKKAQKLTAKITAEAAKQETAKQGVETESAVPETAKQGVETESAVPEPTVPETAKQGVEAESAVPEPTVPETAVPEVNVKVNIASPSQTYLTNSNRPPPTQPRALGVTGCEQTTEPDTPNARPYRGKPPPAVAA